MFGRKPGRAAICAKQHPLSVNSGLLFAAIRADRLASNEQCQQHVLSHGSVIIFHEASTCLGFLVGKKDTETTTMWCLS